MDRGSFLHSRAIRDQGSSYFDPQNFKYLWLELNLEFEKKCKEFLTNNIFTSLIVYKFDRFAKSRYPGPTSRGIDSSRGPGD